VLRSAFFIDDGALPVFLAYGIMSDNTVEIAVKLALEQFKSAVTQLESTFSGAMSKVEIEAAAASGVLDESFRALGVKSVHSVTQEVQRLQTAIALVRAMPGVLPADVERATQAFNARVGELRNSLNTVPAAANSVTTAVNSTSASLGSAARQMAGWAASIAGVAGITDLAKKVIETGSAFEQLEGRLTSLLGSQTAAADAFAQIKELAAKTPFEVNALTDAYAKLTAFGLEPSMEQMMAFADTAATLGGGTQMLERVTLALGQAWTKGKLQGGEIMQMAEAGVPVWDLLAKATGRNVDELQKMSEAGLLGRDVITKLIDTLGKVNSGASAILMDTFAGAVSNAKDATAEFFSLIADSGVLDYLKAQIQEVLAEYERMKDTGELQAKAQAIADTFLNVAQAMKDVVKVVSEYSGVIKIAIEAMVVSKVLSFAGAFKLIGTEARVAGAAVAVAGGQIGAAGAVAGTAAASVGLLGRALMALKSLTVVGLAMGAAELAIEFFRAKSEAERLDAEVEKMLKSKPAPIKKDIQDVATEAEKTSAKIQQWGADFDKLREQGKSVSEALKALTKDADLTTVKGTEEYVAKLQALGEQGKITSDQLNTTLRATLQGMSGQDLTMFGINAQTAFQNGAISAAALDSVLKNTLDASLKAVGVTAETSLGGMSQKFVDTRVHVDNIIGSFDQMAAAGVDAGASLATAMESLAKAATTPADFAAIADEVRRLGDEGLLTERKVTELLDSIAKKSDAAAEGVNSVAEAMKLLGVKSQAELDKVANSFKEANDVIQQSTTATLREKQESFAAYANAAIAANNGVANSFIQARAETMGLTVEIDNAGKATVKLKEDTAGLEKGYSRAADQAGRMANETNRAAAATKAAADAAEKASATPTASDMQKKGGVVNGGTFNYTQAAIDQGITDQATMAEFGRQLALRAKETENAMYRMVGGMTSIGGGSEMQYKRDIGAIMEDAARAAREETAAKQPVQQQPQSQSTINLTLPGMKDSIPVFANPQDANRLVEQLRSAGAVSRR
jgi:tape measure domain-containing protein